MQALPARLCPRPSAPIPRCLSGIAACAVCSRKVSRQLWEVPVPVAHCALERSVPVWPRQNEAATLLPTVTAAAIRPARCAPGAAPSAAFASSTPRIGSKGQTLSPQLDALGNGGTERADLALSRSHTNVVSSWRSGAPSSLFSSREKLR